MCLDVSSPHHSHCAYQSPGPPEVQVDALACLVEMSLHILFPKAQECVHADVEATLRLLQGTTQIGKHKKDGVWTYGETKDQGAETDGFLTLCGP